MDKTVPASARRSALACGPLCMALAMIMFMLTSAGCKQVSDPTRNAAVANNVAAVAAPRFKPRKVSLTLHGYNYTDRYIDTYTVNGQGGANLFVSGPSSGGGGSVCCLGIMHRDGPMTVTVRWQHDACLWYSQSTISDEVFENTHSFMTERQVAIDQPVPPDPSYVDTHFYPDGKVSVALSDTYSAPRMMLETTRDKRATFPRCPDGKKPTS